MKEAFVFPHHFLVSVQLSKKSMLTNVPCACFKVDVEKVGFANGYNSAFLSGTPRMHPFKGHAMSTAHYVITLLNNISFNCHKLYKSRGTRNTRMYTARLQSIVISKAPNNKICRTFLLNR